MTHVRAPARGSLSRYGQHSKSGRGESKHADIGISLPGTGEQPAAPVFIDGRKALTLRGPNIAEEFQALVEDDIEKRFGAGGGGPHGRHGITITSGSGGLA